MASVSSASYDQVPYDSDPFPHTHPAHLATIGRVFGLDAPALENCRVLELGCASGGNLIPMALEMSDSRFVGIDLSERQISEGNNLVRRLALPNIELRHESILDFGKENGPFDYIICHGVFSWVPRDVQDAILRICDEQLSERGIAYISYNTYPGWHMRGVVRDMMKYHVSQFSDPAEKITQARCLLKFLTESVGEGSVYHKVLQHEAGVLSQHSDCYLFHEHLEEVNDPIYFHEFRERLKRTGLQYLGDAEFPTMLAQNLGKQAREMLKDVSILEQEQYMDFLRNRTFRRTLLCRSDVPLSRQVDSSCMRDFYFSVRPRLEIGDPKLHSMELLEIKLGSGQLRIHHPVTKAAFVIMNERSPTAVHFDELLRLALERLGDAFTSLEQTERERTAIHLSGDLLATFAAGQIHASIRAPRFATKITDQPVACPLARLQATRSYKVTNRRHESVRLEGFTRHLIYRLDGRHDHASLVRSICESIRDGNLEVKQGAEPVRELELSTVEQVVRVSLEKLAGSALLVA